jgi:hypothetical protein
MQGPITFCAVVALYTGNSSKHLLTMIDQGIAAAMPSASIQMIEFRAADPTTKKSMDGRIFIRNQRQSSRTGPSQLQL